MRALGKFAVKVLLAICVFICSRAVLAVAHALGWFPEQQLANLILAAPTALQIEVVMWSMLAFVVVGSLLLVDYLVHGRNYRKMWTKIRTKLLKAPAAFMKLLDYFVVGAEPVRTPTVRKRQITIEDIPPIIENTPGLEWKRVRNKWEARWRSTRVAINLGYPVKYSRVWVGVSAEMTDFDRQSIIDACHLMQEQMEKWLRALQYQQEPT